LTAQILNNELFPAEIGESYKTVIQIPKNF
jgi:hypothetical protein